MAALIGLAGCAPTSGVITGTSTPAWYAGAVAPDVQYKSLEGKQASFNKIRQPVAIVAFVAPPGTACCWLEPTVVNLAGQLWDLPMTVAQFSEPTSKCPHGAGCVEVCNLHKGAVMSLCDAQKLAWKAYDKPAPETLIPHRPGQQDGRQGVVEQSQTDSGGSPAAWGKAEEIRSRRRALGHRLSVIAKLFGGPVLSRPEDCAVSDFLRSFQEKTVFRGRRKAP
ncbi:MAG: hypothetical protein M1376_00390 [Planctomycetes bacterium]|nr:hypothetical protein [Planctomycetota bacterium]